MRSAVAAVLVSACSALGPVTDGSSLSYGWTNRGELVGGMELPARGEGYVVPPEWAGRGMSWGTEELVALIARAARRRDGVAQVAPGGAGRGSDPVRGE